MTFSIRFFTKSLNFEGVSLTTGRIDVGKYSVARTKGTLLIPSPIPNCENMRAATGIQPFSETKESSCSDEGFPSESLQSIK